MTKFEMFLTWSTGSREILTTIRRVIAAQMLSRASGFSSVAIALDKFERICWYCLWWDI